MDRKAEHFRIGDIDCAAVSDGYFEYAPPFFPPPAGLLFANAPDARILEPSGLAVDSGSAEDEAGAAPKWVSDYTCLLMKAGEHLVLVDTGAGSLAPTTGRLRANRASEGVEPGDIGVVIFTHAHPDHVGGNLDGQGKPAFPKARWVIGRSEWEFWMEGMAEQVLPEHSRDLLVGIARRNLTPLLDVIDVVLGEEEIVPGIRIMPAPGHTPGHCAVKVSSGGEDLYCVGDLVLHPLHLQQPDWFGAFDIVPDQLAETRRQFFYRAAAGHSLVMAFHFPFPGLGSVTPSGIAWTWEPALPGV